MGSFYGIRMRIRFESYAMLMLTGTGRSSHGKCDYISLFNSIIRSVFSERVLKLVDSDGCRGSVQGRPRDIRGTVPSFISSLYHISSFLYRSSWESVSSHEQKLLVRYFDHPRIRLPQFPTATFRELGPPDLCHVVKSTGRTGQRDVSISVIANPTLSSSHLAAAGLLPLRLWNRHVIIRVSRRVYQLPHIFY